MKSRRQINNVTKASLGEEELKKASYFLYFYEHKTNKYIILPNYKYSVL